MPSASSGPAAAAIEIIAAHFNGEDSDDAYLPVIDLSFDLGSKAAHGARSAGGKDFGAAWCDVIPENHPVQINASLIGRCTRLGLESPNDPISFAYPARLSAIILQPQAWKSGEIDVIFTAALAKKWHLGDGSNFNPLLTGAMVTAMSELLTQIRYFVRIAAYDLKGAAQQPLGGAIVWLIEPLDTGTTASGALFEAMRQPRLRRRLFERAANILSTLKTPGTTALRTLTATPLAGDRQTGDVDSSLAFCQQVATAASDHL